MKIDEYTAQCRRLDILLMNERLARERVRALSARMHSVSSPVFGVSLKSREEGDRKIIRQIMSVQRAEEALEKIQGEIRMIIGVMECVENPAVRYLLWRIYVDGDAPGPIAEALKVNGSYMMSYLRRKLTVALRLYDEKTAGVCGGKGRDIMVSAESEE